MATWLKQSTAVDIALGPFLDSGDGNTVESALPITQPDIRLKKNGGAWAQKSAAQTLSHEEAGWYECNLSTTDTDTLGILIVAVHVAGALPVWREFMVVPANEYDSLVLGSDALDVEVASMASSTVTAAALAADAGTEIASAIGALTIEGALDLVESLRLMLAAMAGKANGLDTTTANYRDTADTKNRIVATVDSFGNRSSVTLDAS